MKSFCFKVLVFFLFITSNKIGQSQTSPEELKFVRQGVRRLIFDPDQSIPLATLEPGNMIGFSAMHPINNYTKKSSNAFIDKNTLVVQSDGKTETGIWFGGFNPFSTYSIDIKSLNCNGSVGFEFSDNNKKEQLFVNILINNNLVTDVILKLKKNKKLITSKSISVNLEVPKNIPSKIILQMLGSGLVVYSKNLGIPEVIGQGDFNKYIDLRKKKIIQSFQSNLFVQLDGGKVEINKVDMFLSTGIGLADIRAITYENGDPMLDQGRLWYTMSIRGRALPHHIQGVFSMNPSVFDLNLEGIILFDRNDGLLRNEIASHLFYDRKNKIWRGLTTGFSAFANPEKEKKQILAIESIKDPRFGFSVMKSTPFGMEGDIEDPHLLFDDEARKWRMLTCENKDGYKAIILESDDWNKDFKKIAGPIRRNSTGTSMQKIDGKIYCFLGSSERNIFIYSYPDLKEVGTLKMDLPPWNKTSSSRVWPNVVELPENYLHQYVALMMDRFNYPGMKGPNWTYGALYLYYGYYE